MHKIPWHVKVLIYYDCAMVLGNFFKARLVVGFCASEEDFGRIIYKHVTLFLSGKPGVFWAYAEHQYSQNREFVSKQNFCQLTDY